MVLHSRNITQLRQAWDGLDFVMGLFDVPRFPRTVSTGATAGAQYTVNSRDEAMTYFQASLYEDCRMNAYLNYDAMTKFRGMSPGFKPVVPNHILIDLDFEPFHSAGDVKKALDDTLRNIKACFTGIASEHPIIIATGNGYHIHVSLPGWKIPLEEMPEFERFKDKELANKFLRFAERRLTNNKADHCHNPSIRSCMFRVPGTINTKAKAAGRDPLVRVVEGMDYVIERIAEERNGMSFHSAEMSASKPTTKFFNDFYAYLVHEQINNEIANSSKRLRSLISSYSPPIGEHITEIWWIDKLLSVGVEDGRKDLLYWVLTPYLITIRKMDYDKSESILEEWLEKCDNVRRLEPGRFYFRYRIRYCLQSAERNERLPIKLETFREYYPELFKEVIDEHIRQS
jgi:hypothetical protein